MPFFDLETSIPFRIHPRAEDVHVWHLNWLQEMGLISEPKVAQDYSRQGAVSAMTYIFPQIPYSGLCLAADMAGITVFLDDYCSVHAKAPERVVRLVTSLVAVTLDPIESHHQMSNPIVRAWLHAWKRYGEGMSSRWREKTQQTWHEFLTAWIDEAAIQVQGSYMDLDAYFQIRRRAIGVRPFIDVAQWALGLELPPALADHPTTQKALDACTDVCIYINDIFSLERELAAEEKNNFVLIIQQQNGFSYEQSLEFSIKKCIDSYRIFELDKDELSLLAVSEYERRAINSYIDLLCGFIKGSHDWSSQVERYKTPADSLSSASYLTRCEYLSNT
ncbi:hypothetical protein [Pseudomonas sp. SWRI154]|uniref:terpene synthase family protein n=1 Tax=Pseudomonas sp. SWRI154 TaxID=2745501 RepID=UPI0016483912|nr:hypothetical protein [Pseudomonas sp. SWRI154]MBC3363037.1 hypothetical protein [Pseudomonas sp. SWRI154]